VCIFTHFREKIFLFAVGNLKEVNFMPSNSILEQKKAVVADLVEKN
jgi:hypothetical protein